MKKSILKRSLIAVAVVLVALGVITLSFFAGFWVRGAYGATSYDWVLSLIEKYYYTDVDLSNADEIAIDALVSEYLDIYSAYYTAEEYEALKNSYNGNSSGLGVSVMYVPDEGVLVTESVGNSPAYNSGIRSGDIIVSASLDGTVTYFNSLNEFSNFVQSVPENEEVTYNLSDGRTFEIARDEYVISYVNFATNECGWYFSGDKALTLTENYSDAISYLPDGVGYIRLYQFFGDASAQFREAVKTLKEEGCTSVILDLRNNGGGEMSCMENITGCFEQSAGEVAVVAKYKSGKEYSFIADSYSAEYTFGSEMNVYILANGNTASASEALIGALVSYGVTDYGNIYISEYSEKYLDATGLTAEQAKSGSTYGKGIMQSYFVNNLTGEALKLTTACIYWPNGKTIHGTGLSVTDGCNTVAAPYALSGDGEELFSAVQAIFGV